MAVRRMLVCLLFGLALSACAANPPYRTERSLDLAPPASGTTLYILPFLAVLTPAEIGTGIFDRFVDGVAARSGENGLEGVILKRDPATVDGDWLASQYYVKGEVFAYHEDSGCCSTELSVTARLQLYQPGTIVSVLRVEVPYELMFEHDRAGLEEEKIRLFQNVADRLRDGLFKELFSN